MAKTSKQERVFVAGHTGLVGSSVMRRLHGLGYDDVVGRDVAQLDLTDAVATRAFLRK